MLVKLIEFVACLVFYGSLALMIEHRKALFDLPRLKYVWKELTHDFFGLEK